MMARMTHAFSHCAKKVKPQEMMDMRYVEEMEKSGFFDKLWAGKR